MGWFSDFAGGFFTPEGLMERAEFLAPLAAGAAMGPAGYAGATAAFGAGAATGAGIAAIKGEDVLRGGLTGGLSGMTGGSLQTAFNPASAGAGITTTGSGGTTVSGLAAGSPAEATAINYGAEGLRSQNTMLGMDNIANISGGTPNFVTPNTSFSAGLGRYGGGDAISGGGIKNQALGAGKLAFTGLGLAGIAGLDQIPMTMEEDDIGKYDPNATLNLSGDKPLDLSGDTGLRLIASGGYIGKQNYSDGGYLEGGGVPAVMEGSETEVISTERDGMSDSIAATIDETQPAALSEGEFVVPADVVSFAGNGSSEAGARKFYQMLGDIREASTGQREQIKEIDVEEYMPMSDGIGTLA